jgi:hypothetical protein
MPREHACREESCSCGASGAMEEFTAFHGASYGGVSMLVV